MTASKIIEGKVHDKWVQGDLIFFQIETSAGEANLIAREKHIDIPLYNQIKAIQSRDFCSFEVVPEENQLIIRKLHTHIKKQGDYFWTQQQSEIVKAYAYLLSLLREHLNLKGYTEVRLPGIHYGKNKDDTFALDFFGKTARLTSSNSLFLDIYAMQLHKAFSIQRCFRAEKNWTFRHLAEFDLLEVAKINSSLADAMMEVEELIKYVVDKFEKSPFAGLSPVNFSAIKEKKFPVLEYRDIEQRFHLDGESVGEYEIELAREGPVFVIYLPRKISSWTALLIDENYTRTFNLLLPGVGEGVEGNQKQTDMKAFRRKLKAANLESQLGWYVNMMPYSNFLLTNYGLGAERLAIWLMGLKDIREIHPIFRDTDFSELK